MVFTALPASPPLKTHTSLPRIQRLGYGFGIFKGGQVHFHGIYSTSSLPPLKIHTSLPHIQRLGYGFGIFKGGQVHFHGIYSTSSLHPLTNFQIYSRYTIPCRASVFPFRRLPVFHLEKNFQVNIYLALDLEFSKGGRYIFMVFTALPASPP